MGTKNDPGKFDCYAKAEDDEPMFVLLARDPAAPHAVRQWAYGERDFGDKSEDHVRKVREAFECATAMELWRIKNAP